ncbi:MAG: sialidase family protein [Candidatus Helarchaeota archaeon]
MKRKSTIFLLVYQMIFFSMFSVIVLNFSAIMPLSAVDSNGITLTSSNWSNATVISDDITRWNNDSSDYPSIAVDNNGVVHVVWEDTTNGAWGTDYEIMYANYTASGWSNATVISDDSTGWNTGDSYYPSIAVDNNGIVHVVWYDGTDGAWGNDIEIMYANNTGSGWSNATVISDDSTGWNTGGSVNPSITVDNNGIVHVVWCDDTPWPGVWGNDIEIMYANYTGSGWSNATVISDDSTGWNTGLSLYPSIAVDNNGIVHVVWEDNTPWPSVWGTDFEIMYANYTGSGWSNATVISDDSTGWNTGNSYSSSIAIDNNGIVHVVWRDGTPGVWGSDLEIMYANYTGSGWSNATVISDDSTGWNDKDSYGPSIAVDNTGILHVVWEDETDGVWGTDTEIMYANYTGTGWSKATVISDDSTGWNDKDSYEPSIAVDNNGIIHVVWYDDTDGEWGTDYEIMYCRFTPASSQSGSRLIFLGIPQQADYTLIFIGIGAAVVIAIIIVVIKKKK